MSRPRYYVLDGKRPVPASVDDWGFWFCGEDERRVVADVTVFPGVRFSTVFIGLDYAHEGPPRIFETMAFRDGSDDELWRRYSTWEEAMAGHAAVVARYAAPSN